MRISFRIAVVLLLIYIIPSCKKDDDNTIKDIDGNVYTSVTIVKQVWMVEDLKTTRYSNGDSIGTTTPATLNTSAEVEPKYQWAYDGNEINVVTYGRLYTWYAVTDSRNVCPTGWHVPTDAEWTTLENYLIAKGYNYDGTTSSNKIAKALASTTLWRSSAKIGAVGNTDYPTKRDTTGFTARPGGYRYLDGSFYLIGYGGDWWSATEAHATCGWNRDLYYSSSGVDRHDNYKNMGFSVRCVKD